MCKKMSQLIKYFAVALTAFCALVVMSISPKATTLYDELEGYNSKTPYNDRLSTYVVGTDSSDFSKEFSHFKTYFIQHDGINNETRMMYLKKGALHITMYGYNGATGAVTIYSDPACTNEVAKINLTQNRDKTASGSYYYTDTFKISKSQTYYVTFTNTSGKSAVFQFSTQQFDGTNRVLTKKNTLSYVDIPNGATYYSFEVKKSGTVTFDPVFISSTTEGYDEVEGKLNVTLCDQNKKAISKKRMIGTEDGCFAEKAVYAVDPGLYWIKVTTPGQELFTVKYKFKAVKDKSGAKLSKAANMTLKKWYKGICTFGDTTTKGDYYKFTINKPSTVTISLKGDVTSGKIVGSVTGDRVNGAYTGISIAHVGAKFNWSIKTRNNVKLPAGTYYIKIAKDTKKTNGIYQIKVTAK